MIKIKNGPKVLIERTSGKKEEATIIKLYHPSAFPGYSVRLKNGTVIPIRKDCITFITGT